MTQRATTGGTAASGPTWWFPEGRVPDARPVLFFPPSGAEPSVARPLVSATAGLGMGVLQLPGRGPLDFCPILAALRRINYQGWTEIFMHPVPRGVPIMEPTEAVTAEINRSRAYLARLLKTV